MGADDMTAAPEEVRPLKPARNGGGTKEIVGWIVGALFTIVTAISGWAWTSLTGRVAAAETTTNDHSVQIGKLMTRDDDTQRRLQTIEDKIDKLSTAITAHLNDDAVRAHR